MLKQHNPPKHPRPVRMAGELAPHLVLREIYRHYLEFRDYVGQGHDHVIEHSYFVPDPDGDPVWALVGPGNKCDWVNCRKVTISFSFWDLHRGLKELAPRKREAVFYNVILDQKQKEVAKRMGITTVSVGQYTQNAMMQLIDQHIVPLNKKEIDGDSD